MLTEVVFPVVHDLFAFISAHVEAAAETEPRRNSVDTVGSFTGSVAATGIPA